MFGKSKITSDLSMVRSRPERKASQKDQQTAHKSTVIHRISTPSPLSSKQPGHQNKAIHDDTLSNRHRRTETSPADDRYHRPKAAADSRWCHRERREPGFQASALLYTKEQAEYEVSAWRRRRSSFLEICLAKPAEVARSQGSLVIL